MIYLILLWNEKQVYYMYENIKERLQSCSKIRSWNEQFIWRWLHQKKIEKNQWWEPGIIFTGFGIPSQKRPDPTFIWYKLKKNRKMSEKKQ